MFINYFNERPYQDPDKGFYGGITDLGLSNADYDPKIAASLYHRYFDERLYVEEVGFDGIFLNEHHSTPYCMGGVMNVEAAILARITKNVKITLLGNIVPLWDDPLWLAEMLAEIDVISEGRLVSGFVRGGGRESISHNADPTTNWDRFQEAVKFIVKTWTTPGPFRWEGDFYDYRYVNPWARPYQTPHPPILAAGVLSRATVRWAAQHRYPYWVLGLGMELTKKTLDYYTECAHEFGYEPGPQHHGWVMKIHVDETEELAEETARKFLEGPSNPFLEGNQGTIRPFLQNLPGLTSRTNLLPSILNRAHAYGRGRAEGGARERAPRPSPNRSPGASGGTFENQIEQYTLICGTPRTIIPRVRHLLEYARPGNIAFWDGEGAMTHDDAMRSLRLMGEEVLPAVREIARELDLPGILEVDPMTNKPTK